jgi:hypothetical protein
MLNAHKLLYCVATSHLTPQQPDDDVASPLCIVMNMSTISAISTLCMMFVEHLQRRTEFERLISIADVITLSER